ncbi:MAG: 3-dehydroquinate synthase [Thermomicrobiales bacterium]
MPPIVQRFDVSYTYPVHFTDEVFARANPILRDLLVAAPGRSTAKALVVVDAGVAAANPGLVERIVAYFADERTGASLVEPPIAIEGGEAVKNSFEGVDRIQAAIERHGIDRQSYVLAIGGGATLDMVGYAAATAHRGVRHIRIPTTVLSQDDSGVGVKNSVNAFGKKNFLGTFAPPYAVINDMALLDRLPQREWLGGVSEAVKVSLLKDAAFFAYLEDHAGDIVARDRETMRQVIYRSAALHLQHIATAGDPFEFGSSRPLDFGHWSAHKLEQLSNYAWRHGEAVSIGISLDSTYAYLAGMLPERAWQRILGVFTRLGLPTFAPEYIAMRDEQTGKPAVLAGLDEFREHLGGQLTIMLLRDIGDGVEVHEMDEATILRAMDLLASQSPDTTHDPTTSPTTVRPRPAGTPPQEVTHGRERHEELSSLPATAD